MSNLAITVEKLNQMKPHEIIRDEAVHQRFVQIYDTLWGEGTGEPAYQRESVYFNRILNDNEVLRTKVTHFSIFSAFIDIAVCGLSVEPKAQAQCYLQPKNYAIGVDANNKKVYEGRCTLSISGFGELVLRARCGQIKYADNPVLVYSEDEFAFSDKGGVKTVDYTCHLPHTSGHIVAGFLRIVRTDDSVDYAVMFEEDWLRLKNYSGKANQKWDQNTRQWVLRPNELYTSGADGGIDSGFLMAKIIKHAFRSYPKARIGKNTMLVSEQEPEQEETDYYGIEGGDGGNGPSAAAPQPEPFGGPANDPTGGVTVQTDDDDTF